MGDQDHRVQFDFDVVFSNGGGLQGQGFRLDIEGNDISDEALARYVVRDMRLLMVDHVRISTNRSFKGQAAEGGRHRRDDPVQPGHLLVG
jgi:hypothetical protein